MLLNNDVASFENVTSTATINGVYSQFNLISGTVAGTPIEITFAPAMIPSGKGEQALNANYTYISMNYLFVPTTQKCVADVMFTVTAQRKTANTDDIVIETPLYTSVPLKSNYKTNIIGKLLTNSTEFNIELDCNWGGNDEYVLGGGEVTLTEDIVANKIVVKEDTVLNLNGYNVESGIEYVAGLTGTDISAITIENGATLTIIGEGTIKGTTYGVYAKDGNLIIKGGNYIAGTSAVQVANATVNIEGGTFKTTGTDKRYVINCLDADYKAGRAVVEITGGTFEGFNPANNAAEGQGTNFVVNGYCAIESDGSFTVYKGYPIYSDDAETTIVDGVVGLEIDAENITTYGVSSANGLKWISKQIDGDLAHTAEKAYEVNGNTIKLLADIDLTGVKTNGDSFAPIGRYCSGQGVNAPFTGHFDGNGKTIKGIYQSGWDFGYEWGTTGYLGLFGYVKDATIENLTIEGMESVVEGGTLAAVAGRADGECVFKNITVKNCKLGTYNNRCGGIVGWTGYYKNETDETVCDFVFENINICDDVVLGGLWGSFDSSIGGVMGQLNSGVTSCLLK
ncbi:MAG: hypothetical protein II262_00105, partial [Alistipes sp.]|nr:hypothetical protein [Alistipes sp.]